MIPISSMIISMIATYFSHNYAENFLKRKHTDPRLIFKKYQIHHSVWGIVVIVIAFIFTSSIYTFIMVGYGIGNIWQHKVAHNKVNEKGMVFITRYE